MRALLNALDIKPEEAARVLLLLGVGFCIGITVATLNVSASTLFLDTFDEQRNLPKAIITSGAIGVVLTFLFAYFESRSRFVNVAVSFLILMLLTIAALRLGLAYFAKSDALIFGAFVCINPFTSLSFLIFWGVFARVFNLRESKRIIGRIDSGQLIASIVALFTIPILLSFLPKPADLLWISTASIGLCVIVLVLINQRYDISLKNNNFRSENGEAYRFSVLFQNPYVQLMAVFINVAMIGIFFVDYSFLAVTATQFPNAHHLANFISIFSGTVVVFSFLLQNFVTDRIINTYGLKIALLINPVLLAIFTVIAASVGSLFGYTRESRVFIIFFLAVSLGKMFAASLKDAVDTPTFKLYFLPLDSSVRSSIQTRVEGVISVFSGIIAGGLLWIISAFHVFEIVHFAYFLLVVVAVWIWMVTKMHGQYRRTLERTLSAVRQAQTHAQGDTTIESIMKSELKGYKPPPHIIHLLKLTERIDPGVFESALSEMTISDPSVQAYIDQRRAQQSTTINVHSSEMNAENGQTPSAGDPALVVGGTTRKTSFRSLGTSTLRKLARSKTSDEREMAASLLADLVNDDNLYILLELLRDNDPSVRKAAIITAQKAKKPATWPILIEWLASPMHGHLATLALVEAGENALESLELAFHKLGQPVSIQLKIMHVFSRIGGSRAIELLWNKIEYPSKQVVTHALYALNYCQAQATDERATTVRRLLEAEIGNAAWNQAALLEIADAPYNAHLRMALQDEMTSNFDRIFTLLSLLYDPRSIRMIRENIESNVSERKVYALELLDVFIDKNLKVILFPLLDDIPPAEEVRIYQAYFPREELNATEVLIHVMNRDFNQMSRWTKACAIYSYAATPNMRVCDDIIAHVYNPDILLRETAAWAVCQLNQATYQWLSLRLPLHVRDEVDQVILPVSHRLPHAAYDLLFEKIAFLKTTSVFAELPGIILADIAEHLHKINFSKGDKIIENGKHTVAPLYIVVHGAVIWHEGHEVTIRMDAREWVSDIVMIHAESSVVAATAVTDTVLYQMERDTFYQLTAKYPVLLQALLQAISLRFGKNSALQEIVA